MGGFESTSQTTSRAGNKQTYSLGVPLKQTVNDDHVYKTLGISLIKSERDLLN